MCIQVGKEGMKPWAWSFRTKVTQQANVFNTANMVNHLDHSSNGNGGSLKVQPRFKCLKIAFHYSGLTSIFKTTCCRDSENPEDLVYQLSATWKHYVTWRQRNAERNWYVTSYQTIPRPTAFSDSQSHEGTAKVTAVTGASPCPRTHHVTARHWGGTSQLWDSLGQVGFHSPANPSPADSQVRDTCPEAVTHSPHWLANQQSEHIHSLTSAFSYNTWAPDMDQFPSWPLRHSSSKLHNLGLISTRIHKVGASCLVSALEDLSQPRNLFSLFMRLRYLLTTPGRKQTF